jgi:hypothetical protein
MEHIAFGVLRDNAGASRTPFIYNVQRHLREPTRDFTGRFSKTRGGPTWTTEFVRRNPTSRNKPGHTPTNETVWHRSKETKGRNWEEGEIREERGERKEERGEERGERGDSRGTYRQASELEHIFLFKILNQGDIPTFRVATRLVGLALR